MAARRRESLEKEAKADLDRLRKNLDERNVVTTPEGRKSRYLRYLGSIAGLNMPMSKEDYKREIEKVNGDVKELTTGFLSHPDKWASCIVLHSNTLPFDLYTLCKKGSRKFLIFSITLYMFILSTFFSLISSWAGCMEIAGKDFLPKGFMLISGLGEGLQGDQTSGCLYIESFAVLVGVYISLPIFGAVVLVRLLDYVSNSIKVSKYMLLTLRDGKPVIMIRCIAANGQVHYNLNAHASFRIFYKDKLTEETYSMDHDIHFVPVTTMVGMATVLNYVCDEHCPLRATHAIIFDDKTGMPKWNHSKIAVINLQVTAQKEPGSRECHKFVQIWSTRASCIDADEVTGALPQWVTANIVMPHEWKISQGKKTITVDLSKLSVWEYMPQMIAKYKAKQAAEAAEVEAVTADDVLVHIPPAPIPSSIPIATQAVAPSLSVTGADDLSSFPGAVVTAAAVAAVAASQTGSGEPLALETTTLLEGLQTSDGTAREEKSV
jgi:hypothetical protein